MIIRDASPDDDYDAPHQKQTRPRTTPTGRRPIPGATKLPADAVYMSYAWGSSVPNAHEDDLRRDQAADAVCKVWEDAGKTVVRDREVMQYGDLITDFMKQIAEGQKIIVILSKKYLQSPYCMYELYRIYEKCKAERAWAEALTRRVQVIRLPCAEISGPEARKNFWKHWKQQRQNYEDNAREDLECLGQIGYQEYLLTKAFAMNIPDILAVLSNQLAPQFRYAKDIPQLKELLNIMMQAEMMAES